MPSGKPGPLCQIRFNGLAAKNEERFEKTTVKEIPNHTEQNPKLPRCFLSWSMNIGIRDLFVIWCLGVASLETLALYYSSRPLDEGRTRKALWLNSKSGRVSLDSLLKSLFSPRICRVTVSPSLPVTGLILSCKFDSFEPFGTLVEIAVGHQCSHRSAVGPG